MNKKKRRIFKNKDWNDYLKTFLTTLFIVVMFGVLNIFNMLHNVFNVPEVEKQNIDAAFESYLVDIIIDKNLEFAKAYPKNYAVNMRLGILYSYKKDYVNAEKEFKNSVEKSVAYDYTPSYQLAKLYVKTNRLQEAQSIMDKIGERPNKRLITFKGDIYAMLGNAYYKQGYYALSTMKYEKALSYYEAIKAKNLKTVQHEYVRACEALADSYVNIGKIDEAVMSLDKAYKIDPENSIINYKLGILYIDNDPLKAYSLLSYVHKNDPQAINYDVYFDLINTLADNEDKAGNSIQAELYRKRALQYQKFVKNNLLYEQDLFVDVMKLNAYLDKESNDYVMNFMFRLQNNSSLDINNLSIKVILKDGNKIIQSFTQKIFDEERVFSAGMTTPPIVINATENRGFFDKSEGKGDIVVELYAYKYPKYRVLLLKKTFKKATTDN